MSNADSVSPTYIEPDDYLFMQYLQDGYLSPDGLAVVYVVSQAGTGEQEGQEIFSLYLMSLGTGEVQQLSDGTVSDSNPRWSPDGSQLAFISSREGRPQIFLREMENGDVRRLTEMPQGVSGTPLWSPDGQTIAFSAGPASPLLNTNMPYRITRHFYRADEAGYVDNVLKDVYIVTVEDGTVTQLTDDDLSNSAEAWSPDSAEILFTTTLWPDSHRREAALRAVNLNGEVREIMYEWGHAQNPVYTLDGKHIVFVGKKLNLSAAYHEDLWVIDRQGGEPVCRTESLTAVVGGALQADAPIIGQVSPRILLSDDGQFAYVRAEEAGTMPTYKIVLYGPESCEKVLGGERACLPFDLRGEQLLYGVSTFHDPLNMFIIDLATGVEQQLTTINADYLGARALPTVERLLFPSKDGTEIEGWLLIPAAGDAPYPLILLMHGGPHNSYGNIFHFEAQMFAGAGYAVLMINHRGSVGYGNEFANATFGDWGNLDYQDLMAGVDYVIDRGIADHDRMGCCGLSFGGYMSCWIVGQTDRFKAAVPEEPITNILSMYGTSDIGTNGFPLELGGKPHEIIDTYLRCSPITHAHKCTTPTLLIQGDADYRCPPEQSEQFYTVLKANGCTVEMLRLPWSPHMGAIAGLLSWRKAQNDALLDWMNRYVREDSPE